eukprot:1383457-Alexandrium_andersonii.AAC.1
MAVRPNPSAAPFTLPASSASPELKAMVFWVVDQCLMARCPRMHAPPARGPPSKQTPGKVRVNVCAESGPLVLPREV